MDFLLLFTIKSTSGVAVLEEAGRTDLGVDGVTDMEVDGVTDLGVDGETGLRVDGVTGLEEVGEKNLWIPGWFLKMDEGFVGLPSLLA